MPKIIVADDDVLLLDVFKHMSLYCGCTMENGYDIRFCASGEEALRICEYERGADCAFLDNIMDGLSGKETASRLKQCFPQMKIYLMSGYPEEKTDDCGVLGKPFVILELKNALTQQFANP